MGDFSGQDICDAFDAGSKAMLNYVIKSVNDLYSLSDKGEVYDYLEILIDHLEKTSKKSYKQEELILKMERES